MLSKNAMNNMKNRYVAVLKKCHLLNTFGTLAMVATLGLTAPLAMPSDAMAEAKLTIPSSTTNWTSPTSISYTGITAAYATYYVGVIDDGATGSISMTLADGHSITVEGTGTEGTCCLSGMYSARDNITITNNGTVTVSANAIGNDKLANSYTDAIYVDGSGDSFITNNGTINVIASALHSGTADNHNVDAYVLAYGINAESSEANTIINTGDIKIIADAESTSTSEGTDAEAYAYALKTYGDGDGTITNSGTVTVSANAKSASDSAEAYAYGMDVSTNGKASLTNSGTVTVSANAKSASDSAYVEVVGMDVSTNGKASLTNSGTMDITANAEAYTYATATAYGMWPWSEGDSILINSGTMNVTANAKSTSSEAESEESASASATVYGMYASNSETGYHNFSNSGTMNITANAESLSSAYAEAYGLYASTGGDIALTNSGTMNITANAESLSSAYAEAYGLYADLDGDATLTNSGTMNITANAEGANSASANAYGLYAYPDGDATLTNEKGGIINVIVNATSESGPAFANAQGVYVESDRNNNTLTNDGLITVTANAEGTFASATAHGMYAEAYYGSNNVTNNGLIIVTANATVPAVESDGEDTGGGGEFYEASPVGGMVFAFGMTVSGYGSTSTLNNFGLIKVSINADDMSSMMVANAYQAYVLGGTANIGTWNMVLGETYGTNGTGYYVFGVAPGATLNFDDNSTFVVVGFDNVDFGKKYAIKDMINTESGGMLEPAAYGGDFASTVTGSVGDATTIFDMVNVELINPNDEYDNQFIRATLEANGKNSPAQGGAHFAMSGAFRHMQGIWKMLGDQRHMHKMDGDKESYEGKADTATMYADASSTSTDAGTRSYVGASDSTWDSFVMPFYGTTSGSAGGYDINMAGFAMGASRAVNDKFDLGFHLSIANIDGDADYVDSDATSYALGLHGVYNVDEAWYVRGQLSGFYSESDLDMVGSTSNKLTTAKADMDSYGVFAELATGYDIALAPQHTITPEVALSYMYAHMEGFDSAYNYAGGLVSTPFSMDSEDYDALYADASVRWTGFFDFQNGVLKPTAKAGIRQALTDPEVSSTLEIFGTKATTSSDLNETAFTCEAGLAWEIGDVTTSLTYFGEFGDEEDSHMGMFKVEMTF